MNSIKIDLEYLVFAYRDEESTNTYYLDTEYGEVRFVNRELTNLKDLTDEIETAHAKFLYVPKMSKNELVEDLNAFSKTLTDPKLLSMLQLAFEAPHIYKTYKAILGSEAESLLRLEPFLKEQAKKRLLIWLNANFIAPKEEG